ncbi:MAG: hypothetical protein JJ895_09450 [Balneolaceae bacterium]|nr:hypothetical protein [Balneolaceae bacterium]
METRIFVSGKIKKVYRRIDLKPLPEKEGLESHINSWNAHFLTIENKKCWLLTHTKTRYTVVLPDINANKIKSLRFSFLDQIMNQYLKDDNRINFEENVDPTKFEKFIGSFEFYPTNNDKSCIAYLNRRIEDLEWYKYSEYDYEDIPFYTLGATINHIGSMKRNGKSEWIKPNEEMLELIDAFVLPPL